MGDSTWRTDLRAWAWKYAHDFSKKPGVHAVMIAGSIGRRQEWRHSDLELGVVVDKHIAAQEVDHGRGVEIYQLIRSELEQQVSFAESGDIAPVVSWPIALWNGVIISDPLLILSRFKEQIDSKLFSPEVVRRRLGEILDGIDRTLSEARKFISENRSAAALFRTRWAMNEAILALHWAYGELPRSQNRTDSRLRLLCRKHSNMPFYHLYREIFSLSDASYVIKRVWPRVRTQALDIVAIWGDGAREFWTHAVDSNFQWKQTAGILTVYRLYLPLIMGDKVGQLDDPAWVKQNQDLMRFLGMSGLEKLAILRHIERLEESCLALRETL